VSAEIEIHANTGDDVGLGHLVRSLALTEELLSRGVEMNLRLKDDPDGVAFAVNEGIDPVVSDAETLRDDLLASEADVVVDSYAFTTEDFERLANANRLGVIDELGDRRLPVDFVVNNNVYADDIAYPDAGMVLRGPAYCMLREPFRNLDEPRDTHPPTSVLVTVGGADLADAFVDILDITADVAEDATVNAIVGPYFDPPADAPEGVVFHREPSKIHELMWEADLAVSGGGQTLYELAVCGTPAVALTLGGDQVRNIAGFEEANVCLSAGMPTDPGFKDALFDHLQTLYWNRERRREMQTNGTSLVDADGVSRVADHVEP